MKKVAILTYDINWIFAGGAKSGGASVVNKNLILEFAKNPEVDLTVFCLPNDFPPIDGVKIVSVEHPQTLEGYIKNLENEVRRGDFDVVLTVSLEYMNHNPILQSQSFRHRLNTEPCLIKFLRKFLSNKKIKKQDKLFENLNPENKYIAVSESIKKDYVKNYKLNPENVYVCHLACEKVYDDMPEIIKNDFITFGCVANNSINKGGVLFLLGLLLLNLLCCRDFRAKIISKNKILKSLAKILGLAKKVEFIEPLKNIVDFYKAVDCLVLPSKNEAFGLVVLEEMSCGKPCIVSNTAGVAEIIEDKNNGLIFNRKSLWSFVMSLKTMYKMYKTKTYDTMCNNAFETSKKYTWKNFADTILNCF